MTPRACEGLPKRLDLGFEVMILIEGGDIYMMPWHGGNKILRSSPPACEGLPKRGKELQFQAAAMPAHSASTL